MQIEMHQLGRKTSDRARQRRSRLHVPPYFGDNGIIENYADEATQSHIRFPQLESVARRPSRSDDPQVLCGAQAGRNFGTQRQRRACRSSDRSSCQEWIRPRRDAPASPQPHDRRHKVQELPRMPTRYRGSERNRPSRSDFRRQVEEVRRAQVQNRADLRLQEEAVKHATLADTINPTLRGACTCGQS